MTDVERVRITSRRGGGARQSGAWPTITFAVPPSDYARLAGIVARDRTRFSTLAREAVQAFLADLEGSAPPVGAAP